MKCVLSVDVEDWFHILDVPSTPPLSQWDAAPSRVERNFLALLEIFADEKTRVTCFFLGWVAAKFPHLVREAEAAGHEVASHGYAHQLVYKLTPDEFYQDAVASKKILEDIVGHEIVGYRAAGFSVTGQTSWFFEKLAEAGYWYDSSVFPAQRGHGGWREGQLAPHPAADLSGDLVEFPMTVTTVMGRRICFFGGGYLRLFPFWLTRHMAHRVLRENRPVLFYVHPREIDPEHPRLPMNMRRRFKSYVNLRTTEQKVRRLLAEFEFTTFRDLLADYARGEVVAPIKVLGDRSSVERRIRRRA